MNMIPPSFEYVIYKDNEARLMREIEMKRAAMENGNFVPQPQPWYAQAAGWLSAKLFSRASVKAAAADTPCAGLPC